MTSTVTNLDEMAAVLLETFNVVMYRADPQYQVALGTIGQAYVAAVTEQRLQRESAAAQDQTQPAQDRFARDLHPGH